MLQRLCLLGVTGAVALGGGPQIAPPNCAVKPDVSGHVFIPPEMTHINASAFAFCTTLIHVTIGPTVVSIGDRAFYDCASLTTVEGGDNVTSIGVEAFSRSTLLTEIPDFPSLETVGEKAFYDCRALASFSLAPSVKVNSNAFFNTACYQNSDKKNITRVCNCHDSEYTVPCEPTGIHPPAPEITNCSLPPDDKGVVTVPSDMTEIPEYFFRNCANLTEIILGPQVTKIGKFAFIGASGLRFINDTEGVKTVEESAFSGCTSVEKFVANGNASIFVGARAFYGCTSLREVILSKATIASEAFWDCRSLSTLSVGEDATVNSSAFFNTACCPAFLENGTRIDDQHCRSRVDYVECGESITSTPEPTTANQTTIIATTSTTKSTATESTTTSTTKSTATESTTPDRTSTPEPTTAEPTTANQTTIITTTSTTESTATESTATSTTKSTATESTTPDRTSTPEPTTADQTTTTTNTTSDDSSPGTTSSTNTTSAEISSSSPVLATSSTPSLDNPGKGGSSSGTTTAIVIVFVIAIVGGIFYFRTTGKSALGKVHKHNLLNNDSYNDYINAFEYAGDMEA